uniref:Glycogen synthase kinase n=1 Tax=Haliotis discus discus TaxID=91233 RepID=B7U5G4_HALDI|nr:glycogen synthase kinase [Haliotis discus discus]WIM66266.1 glycogen synthase kinase [Haliotis discus hannai]
MPVKIEAQNQPEACPVIPTDIDLLVKQVQERLCLKSREKLHSYRKTPYTPIGHRASNGYGRISNLCCEKDSSSNSGNFIHHKLKGCCKSSAVLKTEDDSPHILLQKLLKEQTLIQEAVRRLQLKTTRESENKQTFRPSSWSEASSLEGLSA